MTGTITGHFHDADDAQRALASLQSNGFPAEDLSYVSHDSSGKLADVLQRDEKRRSPAVDGLAAGGVSGVVLGLAALAIPGLGPVLAAGPLAMALAGAGAGAAAGGLIGALADIGVPEKEAREWSESVRSGTTLVIVRVNDENADKAVSGLQASGADTVARHPQAVRETGLEYNPANPHSDAPNYGDEGGSSQWGLTALRAGEEED